MKHFLDLVPSWDGYVFDWDIFLFRINDPVFKSYDVIYSCHVLVIIERYDTLSTGQAIILALSIDIEPF